MGKQHHQSNGVAVVGFPYVRESYFAMFKSWPEPGHIRFLLPRRWSIKGGKVVYTAPSDGRVSTARAFFADYRQNYPVIGGLLKGWMPYFPIFLLRNLRQIQLVYACSEPILLTTFYYALWTRLLGRKLVLFTWENIPYEKKFHGLSRLVHGALLRMNLALTSGLLCGNHQGYEIHRRLTRKPLAVIPMNGLDTEQIKRSAQTPSHFTHLSGKLVFVFAGAIGERKGIHIALEAFASVRERLPDAHFVIAGSGEWENQIEQIIDRMGLRDAVTRFPWLAHHELVRLLSVADVFVYPSMPHKGWAEQFGYSMAEASLMELPVISTRSGSISDVVRDGETGILVPPGDVRALADAMVRLGTDGELRARMGQNGRRYISENYSNDVIARKMHAFLNAIMK